jgi:hypothetical protein
VSSHCNCRSECDTQRCACWRTKNKCTADCHKSWRKYKDGIPYRS